MKKYTQIIEVTSEILEPDITFLHGSYGDNVHHYLNPDVVQALSFMVASIILPIITGCAANKISELIKNRGNKVALNFPIEDGFIKGKSTYTTNISITKEEVICIAKTAAYDDSELNIISLNIEKKKEAEVAVSVLLSSNGWPTKIAEENSKKIVEKIIKILKQ